jgi:ribosomal protein L7Ae-like RNA K-turn-binding protein
MAVPLTTIFSWFEKGDMPTEQQFQQTFSSFRHLEEKIKMEDVAGINEAFQKTLSTTTFTNHLQDESAHHVVLAKLNASNLTARNVEEWKEKLKINLAATVDGTEETGNVYTKEQIGKIVSILQAKDNEMLELIEKINKILESNDDNLDELQEIVDYIKENRKQIELLKESEVGSEANFAFGGILRPTDHIIVKPRLKKWFWAGSGVYENASGVTIENFGIISFDGFVWSVLEVNMPRGGADGFVDLTQEN